MLESRRPARAMEGFESLRREAGRVWGLAWPAIMGSLLTSLVGIADVKLVGSLGPDAVAAVASGNRVLFLFQGILAAVTGGTAALVSRSWGAKDLPEANRVTAASLLVCAALALALGILGALLAETLAHAFGLRGEAQRLAVDFIRWASPLNAASCVALVLWVALRAAGDTRTPLCIGAAMNVLNIALLAVLVPRWGVRGAAVANGIAFAFGSLVTAGIWRSGWLRLAPQDRWLQASRLGRILRIGYPAGLEQAVWQGGFVAFMLLLGNRYGASALAAYGIGANVLALSSVVGVGFSIAVGTRVGQSLGAGDRAAALRAGWGALWLSVSLMIGLGAALALNARAIAAFFIADPQVLELTAHLLRVLGCIQPLMAVEFALSGALRGAGDTRFPLFTTLTGLILFRVGLAGALSLLGVPVQGVFAVLIADYAVKATLLVGRFRSERWAVPR